MFVKAFDAAFGLKINIRKSTMVASFSDEAEDFESLWGCPITSLRMTYLGLPLGGFPRNISFQDPVVQKNIF